MPNKINSSDLREIRCSHCGRFLGKEYIERGFIILYCKNCKNSTIVIGEKTDFKDLVGIEGLTTAKEDAKILPVGQKVS